MITAVKYSYSIYIELSRNADSKLISDFFRDDYSLTDDLNDIERGQIDLIILDSTTAGKHESRIRKQKEKFASAYLPLLVLTVKNERLLSPQLWELLDDVLQIPVPKAFLNARVQTLLKTREYSKKLEKERNKLKENNRILNKYFKAIESVTNGVVITDPNLDDNPIIFCNKAFEKLTGYKKEEILGRNCRFLQNGDKQAGVLSHLRESMGRGDPVTVLLRNYRKDSKVFWNELTVSPIKDKYGAIEYFVGIQNDVTKLVETENKLKQARNQWQSIVTQSPDLIQISVDGIIRFINPNGALLYGAKSPDEIIGKSLFELQNDMNKMIIEERFQAIETGKLLDPYLEPYVYSFEALDGKRRHMKVQSIPATYEGANAIQTVGQDITEIIESNINLENSIAQKEILLQEVHHRVKNNLAVISGLIEIQISEMQVNESVLLLKETQSRIMAIAKVHELLYQQENLKEINFKKNIEELTEMVMNSFSVDGHEITFNLNLTTVDLSLDQAIPCSLLLNELILNTIKHGYKDENKVTIDIDVTFCEEEIIKIKYRDFGSEIYNINDLKNNGDFGFKVIDAFLEQLEADYDFSSENGFQLQFQFKRKNYRGFLK